jgi:hypothetical protein
MRPTNPKFQDVTYDLIGIMRYHDFTLAEAEEYLEHVAEHVKDALKHMDFFPPDTVLAFLQDQHPSYVEQAEHSWGPVSLVKDRFFATEYIPWARCMDLRPVSRDYFYDRLRSLGFRLQRPSDSDPQRDPAEPVSL